MELEFNELRELLTVLNQTDIAEFILKSGEFELRVRKGTPLEAHVPPVNGSASGAVSPPPPVSTSGVVASPAPSISPRNEKLLTVTAPMVGTFYRSPAPDEPPFVDMGDRIRPGQTVCIIEAMKLMNELESEVAGEIVEILAKNGDPVEYGQVLMRVNPG